MARQQIRQKVVRSSDSYSDSKTPSEIANAESLATDNEEFQAYLLSQIKQILGGPKWNSAVSASLNSISNDVIYSSACPTTSLSDINALALSSNKTIIINSSVILDSDTTVTQPIIIVSRIGKITQTGGYTVTFSSTISAETTQVFYGFSPNQILGLTHVYAEWFGDCTIDLGAVLNIAVKGMAAIGGKIILPYGTSVITTSVNATNIVNPIEFAGHARSTIISAKVTSAVFDCVGSAFFTFRDFTLSGNSVTMPTTGFLLARNSTESSAGRHNFYNIETLGFFSIAALYNYGSEDFRSWNCYFTNNHATASTVVFTKNNIFGLISYYAIIATGNQSNAEFKLYSTSIDQYGTGDSDALYLEGVSDFLFDGGFMSLCGNSAICISGNTTNVAITNLRTESWSLTDTVKYLVYIKDGVHTHLLLKNISGCTKLYADGGRTIYASDTSQLDFFNSSNMFDTGSNTIDVFLVNFSNMDCSLITLYVRYAFGTTFLKIRSYNIHLARPDLATTSIIYYIDLGIFSTEILLCNCTSLETIGSCVYISGSESGGKNTIRLADPTNFNKMPAIGIIVSKPTTTTAYVRFSGYIKDLFTGLIPGKAYFVDLDGTPTDIAPVGLVWVQKIGVALGDSSFFVSPSVDMVLGGV